MFHQKEERKRLESFGQGKIGRMRNKVWNLTEYPETSWSAQFVAFFSLGVIILSTLCFILSTFPEFQDPEEHHGSPFLVMFQTTLSSHDDSVSSSYTIIPEDPSSTTPPSTTYTSNTQAWIEPSTTILFGYIAALYSMQSMESWVDSAKSV